MKKEFYEETEILEMFRRDVNKYPLLTREEERELAVKAGNGCIEARNCLTNANLRFVFKVVYQYWKPGRPLMEMISEGCLGLMRATETYDPERAGLTTHAWWHIRSKITSLLKVHWKHEHDSLDALVFDEEGTSLLDCIPSEDTPLENNCLSQIEKGVKELTGREMKTLYFLFWEDLELKDVALKLGISTERVRQIKAKALRKMRWKFNG